LTKATFKQAYENRKPQENLIFHSDREGVYGSAAFRDYMESLEVEQSFSKARVPYDNSVSESFFASMKREELYRTNYRSENEFKKAIDDYIIFYNTKRPHASCHLSKQKRFFPINTAIRVNSNLDKQVQKLSFLMVDVQF